MQTKPLLLAIVSLLCSTAIAIAEPSTDAKAQAVADGYELVWADEFNTDGPPDPDNWSYERGFVRNEELQWYQPENARCDGGLLDHRSPPRTSRRIRAIDRTRAIGAGGASLPNTRRPASSRGANMSGCTADSKCAAGSIRGPACGRRGGCWAEPAAGPAAVRSTSWNTIGASCWPTSPGSVGGEARRSGTNRGGRSQTSAIPIGRASFTSGGWTGTRDAIKLYVDDKLLNETDLSTTINGNREAANPFHEPQYMLLNLAIGGTQGGDPSATEFPARFEVDYVRVYQKPEEAARRERGQMHARCRVTRPTSPCPRASPSASTFGSRSRGCCRCRGIACTSARPCRPRIPGRPCCLRCRRSSAAAPREAFRAPLRWLRSRRSRRRRAGRPGRDNSRSRCRPAPAFPSGRRSRIQTENTSAAPSRSRGSSGTRDRNAAAA